MSAIKFIKLADVVKGMKQFHKLNPRCEPPPDPAHFRELWEQPHNKSFRLFNHDINPNAEAVDILIKPENHFRIHAPMGFMLATPKNALPGDLAEIKRHNKAAKKGMRRQRWQKRKQAAAQFLAKVFFGGRVSFLGATRLVIICRTKVIKFPRFYSLEVFLRGWLCNICERNNWIILDKYFQNKLQDGRPVKVAFAPVIKSYLKGFFVIMQKVEPVTDQEIEAQMNEWMATGDWKLISDFCSDPNCNNFGRLNGDIVVIDYAQ